MTNEDILIEDEELVVIYPEKCMTPGHIMLVPKKKYVIIEEVPDEIITKIFQVANKLSSVLFETLGCQGTNILIQNGIEAGQTYDHFSLHILPRFEGDGLELTWDSNELSSDELDETHGLYTGYEEKLKEQEYLDNKKKEIESESEQSDEVEEKEEDDDDYLARSLDRVG